MPDMKRRRVHPTPGHNWHFQLDCIFGLFKSQENVIVRHILVTHSYLLKRVWPPPVMSWGRCCMRIFCFFAQSTLRPFLPPSPITTPYHPLPYQPKHSLTFRTNGTCTMMYESIPYHTRRWQTTPWYSVVWHTNHTIEPYHTNHTALYQTIHWPITTLLQVFDQQVSQMFCTTVSETQLLTKNLHLWSTKHKTKYKNKSICWERFWCIRLEDDVERMF